MPPLPSVMTMSEIILCPHCQRLLRLPADFKAELTRCPSCKTTFSVAGASAAPPSIQTTLPPPRELSAPAVRSHPRSVQRPSGNPCLIVALVVCAMFLIMGVGVATLGVIVWRLRSPRMNPVARIEEDKEERREQLRQAFNDRQPLADDEIAQQVKPLLNELGASLRTGDSDRILAKFDLDRMIDEVVAASGGGQPLLQNAKNRRDFRRGLAQGFGQNLAQRGKVFHWEATEVRKVKKLDQNEAMVIARHKHSNGPSLKLRWWMTRRNGDWQIYDLEDLDVASRVSSQMNALLGQGLGRGQEIARSVTIIADAIQAVALEDLDGAEQKLAQVRGVQFPPRFEATRQLATGMVLLHRGKFEEALKPLEEALRLVPDLPRADFLRGVALNRLGKPDEALKTLQAYRALLGEDAEVCREIGEALCGQSRFDEAAKEYRKALDLNPKDEELFAQLASLLFQDEQDDQLQKLLDTRAKDVPDSIEVVHFRYRLLIRRNQTAQGIALFKSGLTNAKDKEQRSHLVSEFLGDMIAAGKPLEGYRAAPEAVTAFRKLAFGLFEEDRWDGLRQLLEAHRGGHAEDPWLAHYQAVMLQHDEAWDKAARILGEALKRDPKDADARMIIQGDYVFVLYKMDRWQQAYSEIEPHNETFSQLAGLMADAKQGAELEALVRMHKPNAEDDPRVLFFEARAKVLTKKYTESVPLFRQAYQKQEDDVFRAYYQEAFLQDLAAEGRWLEGYRAAIDKSAALNTVAGQLLSQKKDKALAELLEEYRKSKGGEPWYSFYLGELHLLRGNARQAVRHFAAALAKRRPENQQQLLDGLFRARVRTGEALIAYKEYKADEGTFESLAQLCSQNKDIKQLQSLLDAHRKDKPDDPSLVSYQLEFRWLKRDFEGALRLLAEHCEDVFCQHLFRWKAENHRVRCMVNLKRFDEAIRAAEKIVKKPSGDRLLLVLAYAASGDVPKTIATLERWGKDPILGKHTYLVQRCYQDDDLGPILKSKEFQAFRAKFPEPKEDKAAGGK